jgi:signal transduction histidine kinase
LLNYTAIAIEKALLHQKTEEELEKVKDELVHSERMTAVGRMASKISHDIRNPLSVVLISAMLAKQRTKDPTLLQFLNRIERSGNKMTWLIEELSDFAKEIKIAKKKIDIAHVIQSSLQLLEHQLRQIEVRLEISELPQIMADSRRLEQVFCNLIQNAAQAMDEKGILRIRAGLKDDSVYIEIEDAGHGIADEIKKKIFDPFFTTKSNGIGLGLSIVKEIIDLHKGSISCESKLGEGTRFTILLPIK